MLAFNCIARSKAVAKSLAQTAAYERMNSVANKSDLENVYHAPLTDVPPRLEAQTMFDVTFWTTRRGSSEWSFDATLRIATLSWPTP
jgi:hypothetical protein